MLASRDYIHLYDVVPRPREGGERGGGGPVKGRHEQFGINRVTLQYSCLLSIVAGTPQKPASLVWDVIGIEEVGKPL